MNVLSALNQASGRDKVARFFQYLCRTLSFIEDDSSFAADYKNVETTLSTFRKLLRFGKSLESFYNATKFMDGNDVINRLSSLIKVTHGCYLLCDHIEILAKLKVFEINAKEWNLTANKYWLLTDVLNLVQNYYQLKEVRSKSGIETNNKVLFLLYLDIMKNMCDVFLPLTSTNMVKINPGLSGVLGVISSIIGFILILKPVPKKLKSS